MVNLKKLCVGALLATTICGMGALTPSAEAGKIEDVQARGVLLVGSTGDYKPMSYLNKETGKYEGFDVEVAELLAQSLGVKVQYVPTTWKTLQADTMAGKFDIAMCGVTRTFAREQKMNMSHGYLTFGKTILCRKADVMITETMEARRYVRDDARLAAPLLDDPFTKNHFGILMAKGDQDWLNYVNFFMEEKDMDGTLDKLEDQYIK